MPELKDQLVSDAYIRFFSRTMANFEAAYEGRPVGIGRDWDLRFGEDGTVRHPLDIDQVKGLLSVFTSFMARQTQQTGLPGRNEDLIDEHGYRHFPSNRPGKANPDQAVTQFWKDLSGAVGKDVRWYMDRPERGGA